MSSSNTETSGGQPLHMQVNPDDQSGYQAMMSNVGAVYKDGVKMTSAELYSDWVRDLQNGVISMDGASSSLADEWF